ncbi:hypothetical protein RJ639_031498, partial [Escallonia herrerae]
MLGLSYGELFLIIGATAALIGPKDLPVISRTAGRLAGRAIGYVQMARGQFENVMQQSQARQVSLPLYPLALGDCTLAHAGPFSISEHIVDKVHKELQDTMAQLEAIRHEIRTISFMNPGPLGTRLVDNLGCPSATDENSLPENTDKDYPPTTSGSKVADTSSKDFSSTMVSSSKMHSQATTYARLAESVALNSGATKNEEVNEPTDESGLPAVLPVSAESAGLLPNRKDDAKGSDLVLEAILEAEVARNAKDFFAQPQNQIIANTQTKPGIMWLYQHHTGELAILGFWLHVGHVYQEWCVRKWLTHVH